MTGTVSLGIALDWDGTASHEKEGFLAFSDMMRKLGHRVYIVTMRYDSECDIIKEHCTDRVDGIIATAREAKHPFVQALGINIHIWIDDNPKSVHQSALEIWGWSAPEGHVIDPVHS